MSGSRHLYFILNPSIGIIKIGIAVDCAKRLAALQCQCGVSLELIAEVPGGAPYEEPLHCAFHSSRLLGEWFDPTDELMELVADPRRIATFLAAVNDRVIAGRAARIALKGFPTVERLAALRLAHQAEVLADAGRQRVADARAFVERERADRARRMHRIATGARATVVAKPVSVGLVNPAAAEDARRRREIVLRGQRHRNTAMLGGATASGLRGPNRGPTRSDSS